MESPLFEKKNFILCNVPVPTDYPQSQTHAGIAYHNGRFYLTCSPYPVKKYTWLSAHWFVLLQKISNGRWGQIPDAEKYENPMLYMGDSNNECSPVVFTPIEPFPLLETPKLKYGLPSYNSDPDIFIENGKVFILNRTYYRRPSTMDNAQREVIISLIEGRITEHGYHFMGVSEFKKSSQSFISPCLIKYKSKYLFASLETNSFNDGVTFEGLYIQMAETIDGLRIPTESVKVKIDGGDLLPWHMSLFTYSERLFAIITCVVKGDRSRAWQMLGEFTLDLSLLKIYPRPLTDYNSYRGAATVVDGRFVLYSTTLHEKIQGSKSIDGRNIIMASMSMENLLQRLRQETK